MKETILLGVVAFLVATGAGTWFGAYLSPPRTARPVPSGQAAAGPVGAKPAAGKRTPEAASAKSVAAPVKPSVAPSDPGAAAKPESVPTGARTELPASLLAAGPAKDPKAAKEVGKILISMKPKEAAEILEKLTDDDLEAIIRQLNAKQVAPLFVALPSDRAVSMSRRLLRQATKKEARS